jgi:hypothetical protein
LLGTYTQVYYENSQITVVKSFISLDQGPNERERSLKFVLLTTMLLIRHG